MTPSTERVGRYQLLEPIGVGPCGAVARAKVFGVAGFERQFAIKKFHPELTITSALAQSLSAAARAYGSLEHPRIARMSEFGVAQGQTFTAVEYVGGLDAARLVAEARLAGVTLAAGGALALVSQAARAVGYAHGRGLSHLGLSPTNVIVTPDGDIKITDFGILSSGLPQRPIDVARLAQRIQYLAPEQVANEATSAATDVFALGVIAYELVTGQRTFRGDTPQQVGQAIMNGLPPEPPLPRPIVRVLHRCLARSPFERFPDARALADALDAALRVAPVPGTRKDIGGQVKQTLERLAQLHDGEMSGMVALHVGTGPIISRQPAPEIATLGRDSHADMVPEMASPASTMPELMKPATTMPGIAPPPIPVPPNIGGAQPSGLAPASATPLPSTLLGIANARVPSHLPSIPTIKPQKPGPPAPPPRPTTPPAPAAQVPDVSVAAIELSFSDVLPNSIVAAVPGGIPPTASPPSPASAPSLASPPSSPMIHAPAGRIEVDPPPAFDPPTTPIGLKADELFADEAEGPGSRSATYLDEGHTIPGHVAFKQPPPQVGALVVDSDAIETSEMSQQFVERLREEAAKSRAASEGADDPGRTRPGPESVQMEIVDPLESSPLLGDSLGGSAPRELPTTPSTPPPQVRVKTAPPVGEVPSVARTYPPKQPGSKLPLVVALVLVGGGAIAFGAWQLYLQLIDDGTGSGSQVAAKKISDAKPPAPDAAQVAATPDAAVAASPDAGAATAPIDAEQAAATVDAAVAAPPVDAARVATAPADARTKLTPQPSDQLSITSTPKGAHVYLDGSDVGTTPLKLDASNDRHTIALLLPGYELYIAEVDGKGAFDIPLEEVTPSGGPAGIKVLRCKDKDRYYVFVDGRPTGMLCPTERIDVEVGPHTVEIYDAVSESRKKWDVDVKDTRLSVRVKIE